MAKKKISPKKTKVVKARKKKIRPPKGVGPRIKDERAYANAIKKEILQPLFSATMKRLKSVPKLKSSYANAVKEEFAFITKEANFGVSTAEIALANIRKVHKAKMIKSFKAALGVDIMPMMSDLNIRNLMNQAVMDNIALIKSIPKELNLEILSAFDDIFTKQGFDQQAMFQVLQDKFNVSASRAKFIARDQTSKIIGSLNKARQTDLNITSYVWQTVGDESVRASHSQKNGQEFLWSMPPRDTGHPGEDYNCRCVAIPVIPGMGNDKNQIEQVL